MDRNLEEQTEQESTVDVALRKESVDRNLALNVVDWLTGWSLSARRAWIEMPSGVALVANLYRSLSARRAWIEMSAACPCTCSQPSLSARRAWIEIS